MAEPNNYQIMPLNVKTSLIMYTVMKKTRNYSKRVCFSLYNLLLCVLKETTYPNRQVWLSSHFT